ncbi:uncharacterized protein GGS22DRAFT_174593 [Annulohypoxylon maeteangense]|uniref:uncharacterized protein n=1 Tax=Annulohypoxylon maeteangense TaxID=1927788 RepID=UPI002008B3E7|nr:uncharacterized protein GGS22DRAFT_174593 [Annulohypoxylon maeteangense]KAI0880717.1 hypothetical protein GGS22DRAFT_174593 [Annulohypoxylon maeteangense]
MDGNTVVRSVRNMYSLLFNDQARPEPEITHGQPMERAHPSETIVEYLRERSAEFRRVSEIRQKGWESPEGDAYFQQLRQSADQANEHTATFFYKLMRNIGNELHQYTNAFAIRRNLLSEPRSRARILDMCMAPGGFLATALSKNPGAEALAFSLPISAGGHTILVPNSSTVEQRLMDITMLAADMGVEEIPKDHPDAGNFLPRQFEPDNLFDLVLCDGQVLRVHPRAPYRENREAKRLSTTQLALGLEHLKPGGTMIVLLHKLEAWDTVNLVWKFHQFSTVKLVKPQRGHAKRSSFYMVATDIQSRHPKAIQEINNWKKVWKIATFGSDEEYKRGFMNEDLGVDELLENFGSALIKHGTKIWSIQADALEKASFNQRKW